MSREELMQQYEDMFGIDIPREPEVKVEASVFFSAPVFTVADLRALVKKLDEFQVSDESGVECDRAMVWVEAAVGEVGTIQCGCTVGGPYPVDFLVANHDCPEA